MVLEVRDVVVREVLISIKESAVVSDDVKDHLQTWLESILKYVVAHDGLLAGVCNLFDIRWEKVWGRPGKVRQDNAMEDKAMQGLRQGAVKRQAR